MGVLASACSLVAGVLIGSVAPAIADTQGPISFETPTYATGSVNGQDGWASTGAFDQAVSDNSAIPGAPASFGAQSLRISDAVTSLSFGDQTFSKATTDAAGEPTADAGGYPVGTRRSKFTSSFDFASVTPDAEQAGLHITASPDRGDGARMSYVRIEDSPTGWNLFFYDYQDAAPLGSGGNLNDGCGVEDDFVQTQIASNISRDPHKLEFRMQLEAGPHNDVVQVLLDGAVIATGTSWEDYFRYCAESGGGTGGPLADQSRIVRNMLFRASGTAHPANSGSGFLIDNFVVSTADASLNLTSICTYSGGPYAGQHLWRVTSTFLANRPYTSQSPFNAAAVARTSTPGRSWFLGATNTTKINYTSNNGAQSVTKAANASTCVGLSAVITTPPDGATYNLNQAVVADFACDGNELVSCVGTVADGASIDTSTVGPHTFTVTATSWDASTAVATSNYTVSPPPLASSCKNTERPGAEMGMFPANPGAQSALKVSCLFQADVDSPSYMVPGAFTVHDFQNVSYHNGAARTVSNTAPVISGASSIQIGAANGATLTNWVNRAITGTGIAPRTFVTSITAGGQMNLSEPTSAAVANGAGSFKIDNAAGARSFDTATLTGGATSITTPAGVGNSANFTAADVGLSISGTQIPDGTVLTAVGGPNSATMSNAAVGAGVFAAQVVTLGGTLAVTNTRTVDDSLYVSPTRVSSIAGRNVASSDIGLPVYGPGISAGAIIVGVVGAGSKNLDLGGSCLPTCASASPAGPRLLTIGDPSGTAVDNGDNVATLGLLLDLDPAANDGGQECSAEQPEARSLVGTYYQPGSFQTPLFGAAIPTGVRVVGQIMFQTGTSPSFAAYLVQRPLLFVAEPHVSAHFDLVFPVLPLTMALCDGVPPDLGYTSPGLGLSLTVVGQTASQGRLPVGTGRPDTAQFRAVTDSTGGYLSTVYIDTQSGPVLTPAANFNRICTYPAVVEVNFTCGNG